MVGPLYRAICFDYGDPEGRRRLLIELGRDAIMSECLALLPTTPPQDSPYPHARKKCDSGTY